MIYDQSQTIQSFIEATAARQPAPGGGSVSALVGALSAATGEMVLNYSLGRKDLEIFREELEPALAQLARARAVLLRLMNEDQAGYAALVAARKLPKDASGRAEKLHDALMQAIQVPQAMAATAVAVLELADRIVSFVNYHLLSDLAVSADLAMATVRCSIYNVRVNLKQITDASERRKIESQIGEVLSRAAQLIQRVAPRIWDRDSNGS